MDVDRAMLPIAFDVHAEIEGDTPEIMHPEPLLHLILDLPNQALVSYDKEIIDVQKDCGNDYAVMLLVKEHEHSSVERDAMNPIESPKSLQVRYQTCEGCFRS
jgi:hypothetical protein